MANTVFKLRRSSVAGKVPNTSTVAIGELAINLTDRKLYSSDGSNVWEIGSNATNLTVSNNLIIATETGEANLRIESTNSSSYINFYNTTGAWLYNASNTALVMATNGTERMRISATGNVGIGTTGPGARLSLGSVANNRLFALYDDGTNFYGMGIAAAQYRLFAADSGNLLLGHYNRGTDAFTERMRIAANGNVGVGNNGPAHKLSVNGTTYLQGNVALPDNVTLNLGSNVVINSTSIYVNGVDYNPTTALANAAVGKNRIINGDMRIDQRNTGAAQTITAGAALAYTVDRWYAYCTGANVTGQRVAGDVANTFRYRFTGAASVTAIGFAQRIEALNSADFAGKTVSLSVNLSNSLLTTVTWTAYYANTSDTFGTLASPTRTQIATGTFTVNSTVTRYTTQIAIPAAATTGIEIVFSVGAQTSGTWTIDNVQLEEGNVATPFERRTIGTELALCQRYYFKNTANLRTFIRGTTDIARYATWTFPVTMRANPTTAATYSIEGGGSGSITSWFSPDHSTNCITAEYIVGNTISSVNFGNFTASAEL